ncbi:hypothetical protein DFA_10108 [Cavenderia fasciculata]|uniref:Peptidase S9 prolyl oligopeptidase catalytic domain-containing protein n=1 Tax=Cavenderia fasciculata TaxID=261658 RepID=F4Q9A5_CACFS|nr:uncharacterized protein DFA_10108 [Cavenderia fasciculata]EGG15274.1 hypothetical protein DFA_10108 [Cavenderia fasciculata]|eukprot:XP_004351994.1 hypothetical protein DFA_10108 [Cavenderia fasciculata]
MKGHKNKEIESKSSININQQQQQQSSQQQQQQQSKPKSYGSTIKSKGWKLKDNIKSFQLDKQVVTSDSYFLTNWDVLAPFPITDREYGSDILDAFGGIRNIPRGDKSTYPSDLTDDGRVGWQEVTADSESGMVAITYNETNGNVNWPLIEAWAGETASFFGGWAIADFELDQEETVLIICQGQDKLYLDETILQGDTYGMGIMYNSILLLPGNHTVYVRISGSEGFEFSCQIQLIETNQSPTLLMINDVIVPDIVGGQFVSAYLSLTVLNMLNQSINVIEASAQTPYILQLVKRPPIEAGQVVPIFLVISSQTKITCSSANTLEIPATITTDQSDYIPLTLNFTCRSFGDPFTFTFLDFDQSVQYSSAIPPIEKCPAAGCSIILTMHGAGVDAKAGGAWTSSYQRQNNSWILLPTNRREYGWDWQGPGLKNAWSALDYLTSMLPSVPNGQQYKYAANYSRLMYAGHSMGGHGCWHVSTHYPDLSIAVAVAAGWIDYQTYLPFFLRLGDSWTDPFVRYLLDASISHHNVDMYTPHLAGIPLIARFGTIDDNVPPYHLRRMVRLVDEITRNTTFGQISAVAGEGHWFNGVVDDAIMQAFFNENAQQGRPALPQQFVVTSLNPQNSGSRGGIQILQLTEVGRVGKLFVNQTQTSQGLKWIITSQNVRRFGFVPFDECPQSIELDGDSFSYHQYPQITYFSDEGWDTTGNNEWLLQEKQPLTYGPISLVLEFQLTIVYGTKGTYEQEVANREIAIYLANTLYYQERYSVTVMPDTDFTSSVFAMSNVILISGPQANAASNSIKSTFPVQYRSEGGFMIGPNTFTGDGLGLVFLSPCPSSVTRQGCLIAMIDGTDADGLYKALNLFPIKSTYAVPDYAVTSGNNYGYSGSAGLMALGFWNNLWQFDSSNSYYSTIQN